MDQPPPSGNPQLSAHIDHNRFVAERGSLTSRWKIAISPEMLTYSGGLGILAGERPAAADLDLPIVFVTPDQPRRLSPAGTGRGGSPG